MEIETNIENEMYSLRWNQSDLMNICRICLRAMSEERVSLLNELKFIYTPTASNAFDINKPHGLRILEMILLCCNSINVIKPVHIKPLAAPKCSPYKLFCSPLIKHQI